MADNYSAAAAAAAACLKLHSIFDKSNLTENHPNSTASPGNTSLQLSVSLRPPAFSSVASFITPLLCGCGVLGNLVTIIVLCRRRMKAVMSCRIERASRAGLIGLAVADLLCSTSALAIRYGRGDDAMGHQTAAYSDDERVRVLSVVYGPFVQNACIKSNAWLTVVVAVGRYIVICRPLHARYLVSVTATRLADQWSAASRLHDWLSWRRSLWLYSLSCPHCGRSLSSLWSVQPQTEQLRCATSCWTMVNSLLTAN